MYKTLDPALYTVVWIAPLLIEAVAARHMLDNMHDGRFPMKRGDDYVFIAGDVCGHNTVIATFPGGQEYGTGSAAALASQAKKFFTNLRFGLLVGLAAGLPNLSRQPALDIRLGDVLVAFSEDESPSVIAYDLGKETANDGFQPLRFGHLLALTEPLIQDAFIRIKTSAPDSSEAFLHYYEAMKHKNHEEGNFLDPGQNKDNLYIIAEDGEEKLVDRDPRAASHRNRVWYGRIGSGDKLFKNARKRDELRDKYDLIGLEMEAAGTMNRIPVGVIRGVCDYGDAHKNKKWQPYAAAMAAAYAKAVLQEIQPERPIRVGQLAQTSQVENPPTSSHPEQASHMEGPPAVSRPMQPSELGATGNLRFEQISGENVTSAEAWELQVEENLSTWGDRGPGSGEIGYINMAKGTVLEPVKDPEPGNEFHLPSVAACRVFEVG